MIERSPMLWFCIIHGWHLERCCPPGTPGIEARDARFFAGGPEALDAIHAHDGCPRPPVEELEQDVDALCGAVIPKHGIGWFCTRKRHDAGDHVNGGNGKVHARWTGERFP